MKVIKEHIALFRTQILDMIIGFMEANGDSISARDCTYGVLICDGTLDGITMIKGTGSTTIMVDYSDEGDSCGCINAENLPLETLMNIMEWLETYKDEIIESTNGEATSLLGDCYDEVFYDKESGHDERQQTFRVEPSVTIGAVKITRVSDYYSNDDHFGLHDADGVDYWPTLLAGDRLRIAREIHKQFFGY